MKKRKIIIRNGCIHFIYDDKLKPLMECGKAVVTRASHVEPVEGSDPPVWSADMSPVGGPTLGPFDTRQEALDREVEWLNANNLGVA